MPLEHNLMFSPAPLAKLIEKNYAEKYKTIVVPEGDNFRNEARRLRRKYEKALEGIKAINEFINT